MRCASGKSLDKGGRRLVKGMTGTASTLVANGLVSVDEKGVKLVPKAGHVCSFDL